jgi:23S rRNA (uracil1939-C5)-methyltransferase/tRNA (uracil-5-)-methyltransferase
MNLPPKGFNEHPYPYHHELILDVENVTNLGFGIARDNGWVIQIAFVLPGERVKVRIFRNHKNYSEADCIEVIEKSTDRVDPQCSLFGTCGGCQYQSVEYATQLKWKRNQVVDNFERISGLQVDVLPVVPSPKQYGYRSKLTPHYEKARSSDSRKIGFLKYGSRKVVIDVPSCPIATDEINEKLPAAREELHQTLKKKKGGTLLLRHTLEGVVTDPKKVVSEKVGELIFQFKAGEFFQNNPFILPLLVDYVVEQAKTGTSSLLVDAYCGGGLFSLSAAKHFKKVVGIEISREGFEWARANASINRIENAEFFLGNASSIFDELESQDEDFSLVIDPPRRGCDQDFLEQALAFKPNKIIYVSCDPATQARDAKILVDGGYKITEVQPFDLFPQTRHVENIVTFIR